MDRRTARLGIAVEGSVSCPLEYPPIADIISAKLDLEEQNVDQLPFSTNLVALRGRLCLALTYSSVETSHNLAYMRLYLPFVSYIPKEHHTCRARVAHYFVEPQHSRALYYSVAMQLFAGGKHGK